MTDDAISDAITQFAIASESFLWLFIIGRLAPQYWNPVMVFLGSYLVADIIFKALISIEGDQAISPLSERISKLVAKVAHKPIKRVTMNRGTAYVMFTMTIIVSSGIATIIQIVLELTFKLSEILKRESDTILLITLLSLLVSLLLWLNFYRLYEEKKGTPNLLPDTPKEKSGNQPRNATRQKKASLQKETSP